MLIFNDAKNLLESMCYTIVIVLKSLSVFSNAAVTCEIKLFQNYFSLRRRPSEISLPGIISKLFQRLIAAHEYFLTCSMSLK